MLSWSYFSAAGGPQRVLLSYMSFLTILLLEIPGQGVFPRWATAFLSVILSQNCGRDVFGFAQVYAVNQTIVGLKSASRNRLCDPMDVASGM
jgi:hypothetical protein